jgi:hypothetical protein
MVQDENRLYLEKIVNEVKSMLKEGVFESRVKENIKEPESFNKDKKGLFGQWTYIFNFYKKVLEEDRRESQFGTPLGYVFLCVLAEGLVKIILFFDNPNEYLAIEPGRRTIGNLKKGLLVLIEEHNETKFKELKLSLNLINLLRNNFIHFPFYYSDDYRFRWLFFQVFAYLLDKFSLWNYLENSEAGFIKKMALEKTVGVSLLEVDLYEQ